MSKLRILSTYLPLARLVGAMFREQGHEVIVDLGMRRSTLARFSPALDHAARRALLDALAPFELAEEDDAELDVDAELELSCAGGGFELQCLDVQVAMAVNTHGHEVRRLLESFEPSSIGHLSGKPLRSELRHGGAPSLAVRGLRWLFMRAGFEVVEAYLASLDPHRIELDLVDPAIAAQSPRERFGMQVFTDDPADGEAFATRLRAEGFRVQVRSIGESWLAQRSPRQLTIEAGPLTTHELAEELSAIREHTRDFLLERGVDLEAFPVVDETLAGLPRSQVGIEMPDRVVLPLAALRRGELRAYGGTPHARFHVTVRSDDAARSEPVLAMLRDMGFADPRHEALPGAVFGFRVASRTLRHEETALHERLLARLQALVGAELGQSVPQPEARIAAEAEFVIIDIPWQALSTGKLDAEVLRHRGAYAVTIFGQRGSTKKLEAELVARGYTVDPEGDRHLLASHFGDTGVSAGAAPSAVTSEIAKACTDLFGITLDVMPNFLADDLDVHIHLPRHLHVPGPSGDEGERPVMDFSAFLPKRLRTKA